VHVCFLLSIVATLFSFSFVFPPSLVVFRPICYLKKIEDLLNITVLRDVIPRSFANKRRRFGKAKRLYIKARQNISMNLSTNLHGVTSRILIFTAVRKTKSHINMSGAVFSFKHFTPGDLKYPFQL